MEQGIKFVITGDAKQLDAALKASEQQLKRYDNNIKAVQESIKQSRANADRLRDSVTNLHVQFKNGKISADAYNKELQDGINAVNAADAETKSFERELKRLQSEYTRTQRVINNTNKTLDTGGRQFQRLGRRGGAATSAVTSFSQIIQDAPYGIRGVANNIEQLSTQLIFLQQTAGGSRAAMRAFLSSLAGPAGVLVGISLVSAALVQLQGDQKAVDKITRIMGGGMNSLARSQRDFNASLNEGIGSVQGEIAVLQALLGVVRDETENREKRNQAVQILQDKYPQYLSNLTTENSLTQEITDSVNKLTQALENRAKVEAAIDLITERYKTLFEEISKGTQTAQQFSLSKVSEEVRKSRREIEALEAVLPGLQEQFEQTGDVDIQKAITKIRGQISDLREGISEEGRKLLEENIISDFINKETADSREEIQNFIRLLQNELGNIPNLFDVFGDPTKEAKKNLEALTLGSEPLWRSFESFVKSAQGSVLNLAKSLHDLREQGGTAPAEITASMEGLTKVTTPAQQQFAENLIKMRDEAKVFSDVAGSAIGGFAQKITTDLQTGNAVMDAVVSSMIQAGAKLLQELITQQAQGLAAKQAFTTASLATDTAAATGSAIAGGASAGAATGPGAVAAIPAFIALLVGVVGAAFASIGSFAQGGIVGGGQFTGDNIPIFVNSGERILTQQDQSLLTQFLRGGYANTTNRMGEMGPIRIEGEIRGDNIRLSNERAIRRNRRFGSGING